MCKKVPTNHHDDADRSESVDTVDTFAEKRPQVVEALVARFRALRDRPADEVHNELSKVADEMEESVAELVRDLVMDLVQVGKELGKAPRAAADASRVQRR